MVHLSHGLHSAPQISFIVKFEIVMVLLLLQSEHTQHTRPPITSHQNMRRHHINVLRYIALMEAIFSPGYQFIFYC
jgi:hypothetical protein